MYEDYVSSITKGVLNGQQKDNEELTKFYCDKTASELIVPTKKLMIYLKKNIKLTVRFILFLVELKSRNTFMKIIKLKI